jgi:hypothetical protein
MDKFNGKQQGRDGCDGSRKACEERDGGWSRLPQLASLCCLRRAFSSGHVVKLGPHSHVIELDDAAAAL